MDRISSSQLAQQSIAAIRNHQGSLSEPQQMIASGKRILKPSDDPVATAQAESTRPDIARMEVESVMIDFARQKMRQSEGALTDGSEILQRSRELLLAANSDSYAAGDRARWPASCAACATS
ncbi:MAG: hypothetical protein R3E68_06900 [Burkholderiaceae bacterium]